MRLLTFTNLYPSAAQPRHGIFIEHRLRQVLASGRASARVVAPVPWVPMPHAVFGQYAALARVQAVEERHGIRIYRPRFAAVPGLTSWFNPLTMALTALPLIRRLQREEDFDLIDAHFVFPDGAAATLLGRWLGKPVVVTGRGTDLNVFPDYAVPRRWIRWVGRHASAMVTVSSALRDALLRLGIPADRVTVLRNGVDLDLFTAVGREAARRELGLTSPTLLSVGHLIPDKGHQFAIEALASLHDATLVVVGDGPQSAELRALAKRLGVDSRVRWAGTLSQPELGTYYRAGDVTVLASRMEGMPNVLLESLACGTPVIATDVAGNAEVVSAPAAGMLIKERSGAAIAAAWHSLQRAGLDRDAARHHAEQFGWSATVAGLLKLFGTLVDSTGGRSTTGASARCSS